MCLLTRPDRILMENCFRAFLSSAKEKRWKDNSFPCCSIRHRSPLSFWLRALRLYVSTELIHKVFRLPRERMRSTLCVLLTDELWSREAFTVHTALRELLPFCIFL